MKLTALIFGVCCMGAAAKVPVFPSNPQVTYEYDAAGNRVGCSSTAAQPIADNTLSELDKIDVSPTVTTGVVEIDATRCSHSLVHGAGIPYALTDLQGTVVLQGVVDDEFTYISIIGRSDVYFLYFYSDNLQRCVKLIKT